MVIVAIEMLSQVSEPLITGGGIAGWTSFGLAGMILAWLFFKHLPDKDKQLKEFLLGKDEQISELIKAQRIVVEEKDKQIQRMLEAKNEQIRLLTTSGTEQIKLMVTGSAQQSQTMHADNKLSLDRILAHCEKETTESNEILRHELSLLGDDIRSLGEILKDTGVITRESRKKSRKWIPKPGDPGPNVNDAGT